MPGRHHSGPAGLLIIIRWSKTMQTVASSPVLPMPAVPGHPVAAFHSLISASSSTSPYHPLLSYNHGNRQVVVTVSILAKACWPKLWPSCLGPSIWIRPCAPFIVSVGGGATAAQRQGLHQEMVETAWDVVFRLILDVYPFPWCGLFTSTHRPG